MTALPEVPWGMPYPEDSLHPNEQLVLDLHPHWWFFAKSVGVGVVALIVAGWALTTSIDWLKLLAAAFLLGTLLWILERYIRWISTHFVLTSDRVIYRSGVIAKKGIEIPLERVNNVSFNQSIFERILGAGDLLIESGGEDGQQRFTDIRKPNEVQNVIHLQMEDNQQRSFSFNAPASSDVATQLEKLEGLRDRGSITDEEFEAQKRRLLG